MEIYRNESNNLHRDSGPALLSKNLLLWVVNGKLHRADGPAIITPRGTKKHYWKGVYIPTKIWKIRDKMSFPEIIAIANIELRRAVIEMVGYEKFLGKAGSELKVLHEDTNTGAILYRIEMPETEPGIPQDEPLVVVKVLDGTPVRDEDGKLVRKQYFIRVPPDMTTCSEAIAWTFDMDPDDYADMEKET